MFRLRKANNHLSQVDMEAQTAAKKNVNQEQIAARAYQIWESSGRPVGSDLKHWLQAEQELSKSTTGKTSQPQVKFAQQQPAQSFERAATEPTRSQPNRPSSSIRETSHGTRQSVIPG